ncbi:MAG: hypothetical protein IKB04_08990, partial [Clostridia bacterium]|nr:hypothetical protein [Clostridia bacterium]
PFRTLQEALNAGGEVVLLQDITLTEKLVASTTAKLNLNGKVLTLAAVDGNYGLVVKGNLTVENGTIYTEGVYGIGVTGSLTVNDGTFTAAGINDYLIGNWGATVIYGGTFNGIYNCVNNFAGTTTIYGGTFATEAFDCTGEYESADLFAGAGLTVYGGTYSKPVDAAFCAEGLLPKANADGTYTVTEKAGFAAAPQSVTAEVGETVQFKAETVGDIVAYRWEYSRNGTTWHNTMMEGADTDTLTVPVLLSRDGYQYRCIVTDSYGNGATSQPATLTVIQPAGLVQIQQQPAAQTAEAGAEATFAVEATGDGLRYQWQYTKNGENWYYTGMTGAKTAQLTVAATVARNGYQYRCVITDDYGTTVTTEAAALTVTEKEITTSGPADQVAEDGIAVFTVNVEGEGLTYRWQYQRADGTKWFYTTMSGYNTNEVTVTATKARNGYKYRCIITDSYGNETISEEAVLTVE